MIPMRDGVRLHTEIYAPKNGSAKLPFLITRTPYGTNDDRDGFSGIFSIYQEMAPEGYIFVMQDIRGRYGSEGQFVMQRPVRDARDPKSIDEGTDTYDTIDWLLKNTPEQQRPRRAAGNFLRRLADGDGAARAASRAQGSFGTGFPGRHVSGRRFPPQRRVPAQLRFRIRLRDGNRKNELCVSLRSVRSIRVVPQSRPALECEREVFSRQSSHLERFRQSSRLRRILARSGGYAEAYKSDGSQSECRRLVGSGGFLRSGHDLREIRDGRRESPELPGGRPVESRRLGAR